MYNPGPGIDNALPNRRGTGGGGKHVGTSRGNAPKRNDRHPLAGLSLKELKKKESSYFRMKQQGKGGKGTNQMLNHLRHRLTLKLLGGISTSKRGRTITNLSKPGQRVAVRTALQTKLGKNFSKYYYTGNGKKAGGGNSLGKGSRGNGNPNSNIGPTPHYSQGGSIGRSTARGRTPNPSIKPTPFYKR